MQGGDKAMEEIDQDRYFLERSLFFFVCLFVSREFLAEEENLENVLNKAFLEINKAYERHAHLSADGR